MTVLSKQTPDAKVIQQFLQQYTKSRYFYEKIAQKVFTICQGKVKELGVASQVYCRAKAHDRLEAKLYQRQRDKGMYKNIEHIEKDIADLAGVRIVVVYPSQRATVGAMIENNFLVRKQMAINEDLDDKKDKDNNEKEGDEDKKENEPSPVRPKNSFQRRFPGYVAGHYRVNLKPEDIPIPHEEPWETTIVEIQVISLFRHAWAETGHDFVYKNLSLAKDRELQILDSLSALLSIGEGLLDQLFESRTYNESFHDEFELGSFLSRWVQRMTDVKPEDLGEVESLLKLLVVMDLNKSNELQAVLKRVDFSIAESGTYVRVRGMYDPFPLSVARYIMDQIVRSQAGQHRITLLSRGCYGHGDHDKDNTRREQLRVITNTLIWLDHLSQSSDWVRGFMNTADDAVWEERRDMAGWLHTREAREFLSGRERTLSAGGDGPTAIDGLWAHLEGHAHRPVQFAFALGRLGMVKDPSAEWGRLGEAVRRVYIRSKLYV